MDSFCINFVAIRSELQMDAYIILYCFYFYFIFVFFSSFLRFNSTFFLSLILWKLFIFSLLVFFLLLLFHSNCLWWMFSFQFSMLSPPQIYYLFFDISSHHTYTIHASAVLLSCILSSHLNYYCHYNTLVVFVQHSHIHSRREEYAGKL